MIDRFFYLVGGVVAVLMVAVPVLMLAVRAMKPQAVRFMLFARQHAFAAMLLLVVGGVFGIYGSTKSSEYYIDVRNYSGTYDGQPHAANVTVYEWGYPCMDYVEYALALSGPYYYSNPPAFTDAGTYTVYYSAFKMDDERQLGTCTVKIAPKRLTDSMVGTVDRQSYTGKPIEPAISVADGNLLTTNDYTITYSRNTDIGTATIGANRRRVACEYFVSLEEKGVARVVIRDNGRAANAEIRPSEIAGVTCRRLNTIGCNRTEYRFDIM